MSDEPQIVVEPPVYPEMQSVAEQRRAYVLDCLTQCGDASSIEGKVLVANLDLVSKWLENGTVPATRLKPVA